MILIFTSISLAILIPIFIFEGAVKTISNEGNFGETLRFSTGLKISESVCIGSTLPMLTDIFLDGLFPSQVRSLLLTISTEHRIIFLILFSLASALYLSLSDFNFMPYLYICLFRLKIVLLGALSYSLVSEGVISKAWKIPKTVFLLPILSCGLFTVFDCYSLLFLDVTILRTMTMIFFTITAISVLFVQLIWFLCLWRQYLRDNSIIDNKVIIEVVYMASTVFYLIACQILRAFFGFTVTWLDTDESPLIGYSIVQVTVIILIAALPGRLIRHVAEVEILYFQCLHKESIPFFF